MRSDPPSIAASTSVPLGDAAVPLATRASPWPRERHLGHASVTLATTAVLDARFVGYFGRSRGQRARGVAKDAGRDPPGEAPVAAVHRCGNAYGARPRETFQYPRQPSVYRDTPIADPAAAARRPVERSR